MSKTFRPTTRSSSCYCRRRSRSGCCRTILAYFISDVVDQLDLSAITGRYQGETRVINAGETRPLAR